jgi:hypothetical protein
VAAHALGAAPPAFDAPGPLSVRERLRCKAELLQQLQEEAAAQHALLAELRASIRQQVSVKSSAD